jgi:hypothetical protein
MDLDLERIGFGSVVGMTAPQWRHAVVHSATALIITWTQTKYVSVFKIIQRLLMVADLFIGC